MEHKHKTGLLAGIARNKCPRCREGDMFNTSNPYNLKHTLDMKERCAVCGQQFEPEVGFYYGTGYVSYGLSFAVSVAFFLLWWFTLGFSLHDNSLLYYLGADILLLLLLQPPMMRLSRAIWIAIFIRYDKTAGRKLKTN